LTEIKMKRGLAQGRVGNAARHAKAGPLGEQVVGGQAAAVAAAGGGRRKRGSAGPRGGGGRRQRVGSAGAGQALQSRIAGRLVVQAWL
jgi:hypothetical protein